MGFREKLVDLILKNTALKREEIENLLSVPPDPKLGDYAFPCFKLGGNRKEAAEKLKKKLKLPDFIEKTEVVGPYLNFFFNRAVLAEEILREINTKDTNFGFSKTKKETIMVEFFHANTHKGVHIGHIRNISMATAITNLLEAIGKKVIRVNYQGDIGPHVAKCLWAYLHFKGKEPQDHKGIWLGKLYTKGSQKIKRNEKLEQEVKELNTKIYQKDPVITKLWEKTRQWCLDDFEYFYSQFGVKFERLYFESEAAPEGKKVFETLLKKKVAKKSDGAIIVDLEKFGLAIYVGITGQGNPTYQGKELGLAKIKQNEFKFDKSLHIVGSEQNLFFKQVFKTYELMGSKMAGRSEHISYGLVMLPEGKMSSRDGTMVLYHDLFEKLLEMARQGIRERHSNLIIKEVEERAKKIAFGALKYGMINRETHKNVVFDWERALDFEGNTGPYIQYAHARCVNILEKAGLKISTKVDCGLLNSDKEKKLLVQLASYQDIVLESAQLYRPYILANYLFELGQSFNEFYHACPVISDDKKLMNARLLLVDSVRIVIRNGLKLLGIAAPDKM